MLRFYVLLFIITICFSLESIAQKNTIWTDISEEKIETKGERRIIPETYRTLRLDGKALENALQNAPKQFSPQAKNKNVLLNLPLPEREISATFYMVEVETMHPDLAKKYPNIKTYLGTNIEAPEQRVRIDWTPHGFHAMMRFSDQGTWMIDPYSTNDTEHHISYYSKDYKTSHEFKCYSEKFKSIESSEYKKKQEVNFKTADGQLRKYRLAAAATGEYTAYHGGTVMDGMSEAVTAVNRVNEIFEVDMSVTLQLVANNDLVIYTSNINDPYDNSLLDSCILQNEVNLNAVLGESNFDIGHVLCTANGGLAWLSSACSFAKARGASGIFPPVGDSYYVSYLAHELGHQIGASHTFSNDCQNNAAHAYAAVEFGAGSTIMSYAEAPGCAPYIQGIRDPYFHGFSVVESVQFTQFYGGSDCAEIINNGNTPPVVDAGTDYHIPRKTPFQLSAEATDVNGDLLTYCWDQVDPHLNTTGSMPTDMTSEGSLFRSNLPTTESVRTFPKMSFLVTNSTPYDEILPDTERDLNFQVLVRDNHTGGGSTKEDYVKLTVSEEAGPFIVTAPSGNNDWTASESYLVQWEVANTDQAPVNCSQVRILLSDDGGFTYPHVLVESTPNDGQQMINVPNIITNAARIKVEAVDNVFFDINTSFFEILPTGPAFSIKAFPEILATCGGNNTLSATVELENFSNFTSPVNLTASGGPSGTTFSFTNNNLVPNNNTQINIILPLAVAPGLYPITISGTGGGVSRSYEISVRVDFQVGSPIITGPPSQATDLEVQPTFTWNTVQFADSYTLEISEDPAFQNIVSGISTQATSFILVEKLNPFSTYYWRVKAMNECGEGGYSFQDSFTTGMHDYCATGSISSEYEWIESIVIGPLNNTSGNNGGYADFTDLTPTLLNANGTYNFTLTPAFQSFVDPSTGELLTAFQEYWRIWLDLNQNGEMDIDEGELVYDQGETSDATVTGSFTIPATALEGLTLMRVSMRFDDAPAFCGLFNEGEVEDYLINIVAGDCTVDSDLDGVCDAEDTCPGGNDNIDTNNNNLPDDCEPVTVQLKVFLEGPYEPTTNSMVTYLKDSGLLPSSSPYSVAPWYAPNANLSSTPNNMVDWVLVEVRDGIDPSNELEVKPAILLSDGNITGINGPLTFDLATGSNYYFVVRHRNHLDILTANPIPRNLIMSYDFTNSQSNSYGIETQKLSNNGKAMMFAGDVNYDLVIQATDYDSWAIEPAQNQVYEGADMNLDGIVQATDYDVWFGNKSKLTPPQVGY